MNKIFTALILISLFSCQSSNEPKKENLNEKVISEVVTIDETTKQNNISPCDNTENIITNSNNFTCLNYIDSLKYDYEEFIIKTQQHVEYNGDVVIVFDKKNKTNWKIGEKESCFFKGIFKNHLIIDEGTGVARVLKLYDLKTNKLVLDISYIDDIEIINESLHFKSPIEIENIEKRPNCPDEFENTDFSIAYSEKLIYVFMNNELIRTSEYECYYNE
jgi:hypothetical protein